MSYPRDLFDDRYDPAAEARRFARQWDANHENYDGVKFECLSQDEAEAIKAEFVKLRPGVPVYLSWYFGRAAEEGRS